MASCYNLAMRAPARTFVRARRLRREMTLPEVQLWIALRRLGIGARFRRQHAMGRYILDFYVPSAKLAVEIDGSAHDIAEIAARDERRDAWLAEKGIRILRFNAVDVLDPKRRENVLDTIAAALALQD